MNNEFLNKPNNFKIILELKHENKYLKEVLGEEKKKLTTIIKVLNKEIESIKEDNRILNNEIEHFQNLKIYKRIRW